MIALKESLADSPFVVEAAVGTERGATSAAAGGQQGPPPPRPPAPPLVGTRHFEAALLRVGPSVSRKDVRQYDAIR